MGVGVLYDDREISAGEKFADSDLIGIPYRVVVSEKTVVAGRFEVKERKNGEVKMVTEQELFKIFLA
jgi:prolyl-tRNA synthetase